MYILKTFEDYKLTPHKNYDERNKYAEEKLLKILQNKYFDGDIFISDKYNINSLYNIEEINGTLRLYKTKFKNLEKLKKVKILNIKYNYENINLSSIKEINKLYLSNTEIDKFPDIYFIDYIYLQNISLLKFLPDKLIKVISLNISNLNNFNSMNNLKYIDYLTIYGCPNLKTLGNLKEIYTKLDISRSNITDLGNLNFCKKIIIREEQLDIIKGVNKFNYNVIKINKELWDI